MTLIGGTGVLWVSFNFEAIVGDSEDWRPCQSISSTVLSVMIQKKSSIVLLVTVTLEETWPLRIWRLKAPLFLKITSFAVSEAADLTSGLRIRISLDEKTFELLCQCCRIKYQDSWIMGTSRWEFGLWTCKFQSKPAHRNPGLYFGIWKRQLYMSPGSGVRDCEHWTGFETPGQTWDHSCSLY